MGFLGFVNRQLNDKPAPISNKVKLTGQVAIVTGANVGLGLEAARQLAQHSAQRVILGVRDVRGGEKARSEITKQYLECDVQVWELDLNSYRSITDFCKRAGELDRLDVVILNAGIQKRKFEKSSTGHEIQIQVNYLSTALTSLLLLPKLKSSSKAHGQPGHLTVVSSEMYEWTTAAKQRNSPDLFAKLDDPTSFSPEHYSISKLFLALFVYELASKTNSSEAIINLVNPGLCWSSLHRDHDSFGLRAFKHAVAWSSEQGAYCIVDALVVKGTESHGRNVSEQKFRPFSKFVESDEGKKFRPELWSRTLELLRKEAPDADIEE